MRDQDLDDVLDALYDFVDSCLDREEFHRVDRMLSECTIESAPHVILVGMISTTFCAAQLLPSRPKFVQDVAAHIGGDLGADILQRFGT